MVSQGALRRMIFKLEIVFTRHKLKFMKALITYWQETDGRFLGFLNDYPEHWTQGDDLEDLRFHLRDLYQLFSSGNIPGIRKEEELEVA
jgi:predicted RNase H-like HicB family nuclease